MDGSDLIVETATAEVKPDGTENSTSAKKNFVTPEISVPGGRPGSHDIFPGRRERGHNVTDLAVFLRWKVRPVPIPFPRYQTYFERPAIGSVFEIAGRFIFFESNGAECRGFAEVLGRTLLHGCAPERVSRRLTQRFA